MSKIAFQFLLFLILLPGFMQGQGKIAQLLTSAKKLESLQNEPAALSKYMAILDLKRNHYFALWNASILLCKVGGRISDEGIRDSYYNRSENYAKEAIAARPDSAYGYYALANAYNRKSDLAGSKELIKFAKGHRENAMKALKCDNTLSEAWNQLGLWHYRMSNLKGGDKAAAGVLFGGAIKDASNENAIKSFEHAIEFKKGIIEYHYNLGRGFVAVGRNDLAKEQLKLAILIKPSTGDDPLIQRRCKELLEGL